MESCRVEKGTITKVVINRANVANSLNQQSWKELYEIMIELSLDNSIKVIVLIGEGEKAFCAGSDISEMVNLSAWESACFDEICHKAHLEILRMSKLVVPL